MSIEIYFLDESGIVLDDYNKPLYVISSDVINLYIIFIFNYCIFIIIYIINYI